MSVMAPIVVGDLPCTARPTLFDGALVVCGKWTDMKEYTMTPSNQFACCVEGM